MLPKNPGPHKIDLATHKQALFELTKAAMAKNSKLYQFKSVEEFENDLSIKHPCEIYIWTSEKEQPVGFFAHYEPQEDTNELLIIVVHPNFQNQGYGKKMMEFYFSITKSPKSILSTHEKNNQAIKFYESLGYKISKILKNQYGDGQTRILLKKNLHG